MNFQPAALRERLATVPVIKSGLSLMTGTMVTSALGLLFWILAANLYEPADFGVSTTAVYTMMMLADVACLGLRTGLVRYIPRAGSATARTIMWGYAVVLSASTVTAAVFLFGLNLWAPDLVELRNSVLLFIFFVASTAFWALFMLEDAVLVGLRKAPWVPVENTLFGVLKILLLIPFASLSPTLGIFWAWTLPVFPIVIGINVLIAGQARFRPGGDQRADADPVRAQSVDGQTNGADGSHQPTGSFEATGSLGAETVPADRQVVPHAHIVTADGSIRSLLREILTFSLADWLAALARLIALGVIPLMVLAQTDRAQAGYFQASWLIAFTIMALSSNAAYALLAETSYDQAKLHRNSLQAGLLSLGLTVPVMLIGLIGAPLLLLIYGSDYSENSSTVLRILLVAAVPNVMHQLFIGRLRAQGHMVGVVFFETLLSAIVVGLSWFLLPRLGIDGVGIAWLVGLTILGGYAAIVESLWWWAPRIDTRFVRSISAAFRRARAGRPARGLDDRLGRVLSQAGLDRRDAVWHHSGEHLQTAVVTTGSGGSLEVAFARTAAGASELNATHGLVDDIRSDPALAGIVPLVAQPMAHGTESGAEYLAMSHRPGIPVADALRSGRVDLKEACRLVLESIQPLHDASGYPVVVDEAMLESWIAEPISHIMSEGRASRANVEVLQTMLTDDVVGTRLSIGRIQGNLTLDNVRMSQDQPVITGVRRWDRSQVLPLVIDPAVLALTAMAREQSRELGDLVRALLRDPRPFEEHPAMANGPQTATPTRAVLLLAWLHLVGQPHTPDQAMSSDVFWLARNAQPVLAGLQNMAGSAP